MEEYIKAIFIDYPKHIFIKDIPRPKVLDNHVLVKVESAGICGSDIAAFIGSNPLVTYPRLIGHEIAGEVVELSAGENRFVVGDRVVLEPYIFCGNCYPCSISRFNCCENLKVLGVHVDGGMCEYISHPVHLLHKVDKDVPWHLLALVEPLSIAVHAVERAKVEEGEYIVVSGCGPIGLLIALCAIVKKAKPIMIDPLEKRLELARIKGIEYLINPVKSNAINEIKNITHGRMAEVVIEASGNEEAIQSTLDYVSFAGRVVLVGWPKFSLNFATSLITKKELNVYGSRNSCRNFPLCINLIKDRIVNVESVITNTISFDEIPKAVQSTTENPEYYMKVIAML